jgi:hypothetical protein
MRLRFWRRTEPDVIGQAALALHKAFGGLGGERRAEVALSRMFYVRWNDPRGRVIPAQRAKQRMKGSPVGMPLPSFQERNVQLSRSLALARYRQKVGEGR